MMNSQPIYNPVIPCVQPIAGGVYPGLLIRIRGNTFPNSDRFAINLQCGPNTEPRDDIALHLNVRFEHMCIVRNNLTNMCWGPEEIDGGMPIARGQPFEGLLLIEHNSIKVAFNGSHFCEFPHRVPYQRITHMTIDGDVSIQTIGFEGAAPPPQYAPPAQPGYGYGGPQVQGPGGPYEAPPMYAAGNYGPQPTQQRSGLGTGGAVGLGVGALAAGGLAGYALGGGFSSHDSPEQSTQCIVAVPNGKAAPGLVVMVSGIVPNDAYNFTVNLMLGAKLDDDGDPTDEVPFFLELRYYNNTVVMGTTNYNWDEERFEDTSEDVVDGVPLNRGQPFEISILVEKNNFKVSLNRMHFHDYRRSTNIESVTHVAVVGTVDVKKVDFLTPSDYPQTNHPSMANPPATSVYATQPVGYPPPPPPPAYPQPPPMVYAQPYPSYPPQPQPQRGSSWCTKLCCACLACATCATCLNTLGIGTEDSGPARQPSVE